MYRNLDPSKEYGFDFLKGNLINDENPSQKSDLVFKASGSIFLLEAAIDGDWDMRTDFTFTHASDGIIERKRNEHSKFQFIHQAPQDGYETHFTFFNCTKNEDCDVVRVFPTNVGYYVFRFSRKNENNLYEAYYGIIERMNIGKSWKTGKMYFDITYCLNTDSEDRNVEYFD